MISSGNRSNSPPINNEEENNENPQIKESKSFWTSIIMCISY